MKLDLIKAIDLEEDVQEEFIEREETQDEIALKHKHQREIQDRLCKETRNECQNGADVGLQKPGEEKLSREDGEVPP